MTTETRERIHRLRASAEELYLDNTAVLIRLAAIDPRSENRQQDARGLFHDLTAKQRELAAEDDPTGHFGDQLARIPDLIDAALDLVR